MVKSNLDALAPCVLKSSESFFLESILGNRNSIEKQVFSWEEKLVVPLIAAPNERGGNLGFS